MPQTALNRRFSVAPMMAWTDRHCRMFHRTMTSQSVLYTEMVTTGALIYGDRDRYLSYNDGEHPVALQLGGSNPKELSECAKMAEDYGYDEVNLNVGCPSDRVQNNMIGACLMAHPAIVRDCLGEMQQAVGIPITVKHRLGIDDLDSDEHLHGFISTVKESGCKTFIIHARKAILDGLSPKDNRDIPPLQYERAYAIKQLNPELEVILNGGIKTLETCLEHLKYIDGVMVGREAYHNPYMLIDVDTVIYGSAPKDVLTRAQVLEAYFPYIEQQLSNGVALNHILRHLLGLFHGERGGKQFRRVISENAHKPGAGIDVLQLALEKLT
ncbi:tRNA dihydrouridine(20/20a) synthase DusA [Neptunomonas phycophila]|uniref:tRNA-dihydrouridine(20/20a) synthase n=2 Tax=Neptunomonas phycophila TaxID=1572645 RepID=A0ABT9EYP7_9GAMM|nr:tRNA dihydrouridine(20/20a) synthase DusA [Neptunomonas phycophila]MDP2523922.1 tRNA dihydrouridine(20/20a) synthase DusA [Neptunomonas phycophila]